MLSFQIGSLHVANSPFGTSAMVASKFECLVVHRALCDEGQVRTCMKAYDLFLARVFQVITTYGLTSPSLHTESTHSVILLLTGLHVYYPQLLIHLQETSVHKLLF